MRLSPAAAVVALLLALPAAAAADTPAREQEPIVLTGAQLGDRAVPANQTARPPLMVALRSGDEPRTAADGSARRCWHPQDGLPDGSDRFFQGSIATHGLHLLFLADSDNARQTVPATEIVSDWTLVMLPASRATSGSATGARSSTRCWRPSDDRPNLLGGSGALPTLTALPSAAKVHR